MSKVNAPSLTLVEVSSVLSREEDLLRRIASRRFLRARVGPPTPANDNASPTPPQGDAQSKAKEERRARVGALRRQFLRDPARVAEVLSEVRTRFVCAVQQGRVERDRAGHWLAATTWRTGGELFRDWVRTESGCVQFDEGRADSATASTMASVEDRLFLERVLAELTAEERALLAASVDDAYDTLACELGVSVPTLRQRVHALRRRLRERWAGDLAA